MRMIAAPGPVLTLPRRLVDTQRAAAGQPPAMAADGARHAPTAPATSALDIRVHAALNLGRPLSAVRVEARVGQSCQVSAAVSADAGVACFNAWGRLPVPNDGAEALHLKASRRSGAGPKRRQCVNPGTQHFCAAAARVDVVWLDTCALLHPKQPQ